VRCAVGRWGGLVMSMSRVNLDPEGIAVASDGGFWIASEGAGTVNDAKYPVTNPNMILKVDTAGVIQQVL